MTSTASLENVQPRFPYSVRLQIWESDYGRNGEWLVERYGEPIAILTDPVPADMFWVNYKITPTSTDTTLRNVMLSNTFWRQGAVAGLKWRSCDFGTVVDAIAVLLPTPTLERISMRGLYIPIAGPNLWDRGILAFRKFKSSVSGKGDRQ